jgi:hypothetical protein
MFNNEHSQANEATYNRCDAFDMATLSAYIQARFNGD